MRHSFARKFAHGRPAGLSNANAGDRSIASATQQRAAHLVQSPRRSSTMDGARDADGMLRGKKKRNIRSCAAPSITMDTFELHAAWERKIRRLQRAHPERWHVRGWSDEEVRDALTLRVLEVAACDEETIAAAVRERLNELRRTFRLRVRAVDEMPSWREVGSDEERILEREQDVSRATAGARAESRLGSAQRRWLEAMRSAANDGAFFASSDDLNLAAAARALGKDRSSAKRAWDVLRARFARERSE